MTSNGRIKRVLAEEFGQVDPFQWGVKYEVGKAPWVFLC